MSPETITLTMNEDNTFTHEEAGFLTIQEWAVENNVSERSVKRWLADDELPGAKQVGEKRKWLIPSTAVRTRNTETRAEVAVLPPATTELAVVEPDLTDEEFQEHLWKQDLKFYLDRMPTYIPVRTGALMLGLGIGYVKANPEDFGIIHRGGPNQSDVMPKRVILERAGLV